MASQQCEQQSEVKKQKNFEYKNKVSVFSTTKL
jgi:hypothetical protein